MPGTQKKRRRKRRGTQGGSVDHRAARGRPRNRQEAKARARQRSSRAPQRGTSGQREPTWRGAINRAVIAAGLFFALLLLLFNRPLGEAAGLSIFMLAVYVPMGYYLDRFFYRIRMRREAKEREQQKAEKASK